MQIAITKMSSKGQIVIPAKMRGHLHQGEDLILIKNKYHIVMKKATTLDKKLKDDLIFAKRTEEALKRYEKGLFKKMTGEEFLKEIEKW